MRRILFLLDSVTPLALLSKVALKLAGAGRTRDTSRPARAGFFGAHGGNVHAGQVVKGRVRRAEPRETHPNIGGRQCIADSFSADEAG